MTLIISCVTVAACYGGGPHVAGYFLFLLVSNALDVEGTGDGVCKMSEDPSETSFSLLPASVVRVVRHGWSSRWHTLERKWRRVCQ